MKWQRMCLLVVVSMLGCSSNTVGTEAAARKFFEAEFTKWMEGESSTLATRRSTGLSPPISFDIRSIVRGKPDFFACQDTTKIPRDWHDWPAFKFNVAIEWTSEAETPLTKVTAYTLTWNTNEKRWYATDLF